MMNWNKKSPVILLVLFLLCSTIAFTQTQISTSKPWTYWWWMGSAVNQNDIKKQLMDFSQAGLGGVHIIPIYGAKGFENQFIPFLSEKWLEMVQFTINQANLLNLGVDISLGTGWPYGGPWVDSLNAAKRIQIQVDAQRNGRFVTGNTKQLVKRAAPGGEGLVIDYFDKTFVQNYLHRFDSIFSNSKFPIKPRAWYHDSYEVYQANWSLKFKERFNELHGYNLTDVLQVLSDTLNPDRPLVVHDYRETLSNLLFTEFATSWTNWCTGQGAITRYQAHGSPGNLLDLYALADIPETESFGCSNFPIPKLQCDPDYEEDRFGRPSPLMMKFASSPAHLLNKPLVSSETGTWLANHFKVSLSKLKPQIDELFVSGINHVFFHGINYSPQDEKFPGWLFYASTNYGPSSHFWDELPLLTSYISDCQSILQKSDPDNDILLYFPIDELWTKFPGDLLLLLDVHKYSNWFGKTEFGKTAKLLWDNGFAFDYISDKQIGQLKVESGGKLLTGPRSHYSVIIVPSVTYINKATLNKLDSLAQKGARIIFVDKLPDHFAGLSANKLPENELTDLQKRLFNSCKVSGNLLTDLKLRKIRQEEIKTKSLDFIRKRNGKGIIYFVTNQSNRFYEDSVFLSSKSKYFEIFDPVSKLKGYIKSTGKMFLQLPPGRSCFIQLVSKKPESPLWQYFKSADTICLANSWVVNFTSGNVQKLKSEYKIDSLKSWAEWSDDNLKSFCGKARYVQSFSLKDFDPRKRYKLFFDEIHETASVTINGTYCGTVWSLPWSLEIPSNALKRDNTIEIVVQNLSANLIKEIDTEQVPWKKFYNINFVDIKYKPFDASGWDYTPSGLCGRVMLVSSTESPGTHTGTGN
jgi:hypothetical protein